MSEEQEVYNVKPMSLEQREEKHPERVTRRLNNDIIEFVDGKGFGNMSHAEGVKLLFMRLAAYEDSGISPEEVERLRSSEQAWREEAEVLMRGANAHNKRAQRLKEQLNQAVEVLKLYGVQEYKSSQWARDFLSSLTKEGG